ncbi:MAG TPA: hypothetical protein VLV78_15590 [Thermoanaerobaculia bacterium]|nr:hypothetical protein [Thermoanaerobaculia bacterium]
MARQPFSQIIPNLFHDSGPPLHYFLARFDSVVALRWMSLVFAAIQFVLVMRKSLLGAALLAVYPPAVLFAADARAYALCALLVTAGVIALDAERPLLAAALLVLAAYSHSYGVLLFPVLLLDRKGFRALFAAIVLFLPGFFLAFHQPAQALRWNRESLLAPLANLSFAGMYPYALFAAAPLALVVIALALLVIALWRPVWRPVSRPAIAVLLPLGLVTAFHLAGRPVYFPMRFEAVIAGPLALWLGRSLCQWPRHARQLIAAGLLLMGSLTISLAIADHLGRPLDAYREAALGLRGTSETVVATGYLYLETVVALNRPVIAWPAEQAQHPGWRATLPPDPHALPPGPFLWVGERYAPELRVLREARSLRPLFWNERALVARAPGLTPPVH